MRSIISGFLVLFTLFCFGQELDKTKILRNHLAQRTEKKEIATIQIPQFLDTCIYGEKCGEFCAGSIKEFGIIKGAFLTIDRRLRCNQLAKSQLLPVRFSEYGLVKDHWKNYRIETD